MLATKCSLHSSTSTIILGPRNQLRSSKCAPLLVSCRQHPRCREMASSSQLSSNGEDNGGRLSWEIPDLNEKSTKTHGVLNKDSWAEFIPPTDFTQFFKSFDWSATALGPLHQWQFALRMHTFVLFSDQRPGCILWSVCRKPTPCSISDVK